ncbi:MAG TPA: aminotransferase class I/II-fold pyridoxal phosphate-dependent enzyme [candidate division Zixibacteria bacterium]|nr:aminotransferase class I/II-fold pyridoxal phosphate-dependent enzyme [candidate division Zixibacteria bacterium]
MALYSKRLEPLLAYPFAEIDRAKREAQTRMRVVDFGVGDPDIHTDKAIQGALVAGLAEDSAHKYPSYNGNEKFRRSVARYMLNRWRVKLDPDAEVLSLIGSKEGIAHLPLAVLNPGDVACYPDPGYPVYRAGIILAGGEPVALRLREENGFLPDLEDIPVKAKLVWLNYPNNPTAQTAPKEFWHDAVEHARERGYLLVNDAAYSEIYYGDRPSGPLAVGGKDVAMEIHSLSKPFSMCGYRVGFAVGSSEAIFALGALKKNIDSGVFNPIQDSARAALDNFSELIPPIRKIYSARVKRLHDALVEAGWQVFPTNATFYIWAKVPASDTSADFAKMLIENHGIVTLPGSAMGDGGEGYIRFSLTLPDEDLELGIERLREVRL